MWLGCGGGGEAVTVGVTVGATVGVLVQVVLDQVVRILCLHLPFVVIPCLVQALVHHLLYGSSTS